MQEALENITAAVKSGRTDIVKSLIDACQNVDDEVDNAFSLEDILNKDCTPYGTLLHWTTKLDEADIVRTLLSVGANPTLRNKEGETCLQYVLSDTMSSIYNEELLRATAQSKLEDVKRLLDAGVDVNCYDSDESMNTPLHWAASYSDLDTITCLLDHGADVTMKNTSGTTPLHDAVDRGDVEVIKLLLEKKASPLICAHKGKFASKSCLDLAVEKPEILTLLVQHSSANDLKNGISDSNTLNSSPSLESLISINQDALTAKFPRKSFGKIFDDRSQKVMCNSSNSKIDGPLKYLWPMPKTILPGDGPSFNLEKNVVVAVQFTKDQDAVTRNRVLKMWEEQSKHLKDLGIDIEVIGCSVGEIPPGGVSCHINNYLFKHNNEYKLNINENLIKLVASDELGLFYGIQTLRQLIRLYFSTNKLPTILIHDWPSTKMRAVLFDISIRFRVPCINDMKNTIDKLSYLKINQLHLHTRFGNFDGWQHPYTPSELSNLDEYCHNRNISLIPTIDVDHLVTSEKLVNLSTFFSRYVACFSSSLIHIGPRLSSLIINPTANDVLGALRKYLSFIIGYSAIYLCANSLRTNLDSIIKKLPSNIILLDYGFHADYDFNATCQKIHDNGVNVVPCCGTAAWNSLSGCPEAAIMNTYNGITCVNSYNLSGIIVADWTGSGHITDTLFNWPGFILASGFSWNLLTPWDTMHEIIADLVNYYAKSDHESPIMLGKLIMELGRIETYVLRTSRNQDENDVSNLPSAVGSTLFQLLIDPDSINLEHMTAEIFQKSLKLIKAVISGIPKATEDLDAKRILLSADLMLVASRMGKSLLLAGQNPSHKTGLSVVNVGIFNLPNTTKTDMANRLLEITDRYRNIWLSSNLAPGLQSTLLLMTSLLQKLIPDSIPEDANSE